MKKVLFYIIALLVCIIIAENIGEYRAKRNMILDESTDTLILRDTILKPYCVENRYVDTKYVMLPSVRDTINNTDTITDSVMVALPITRKVYEDSTYKAVVKGYEPELESMIVKSRIITNTRIQYIKTKSKWGAGIQVGYGFNGKELSPYIGIGVMYNILTW